MNKRWHTDAAATLAVLLVAASSLHAAESPNSDDGWLAWQGCWHAEGSVADNLLCILPDGDGVRLITLIGANVVSEERVTANGVPRSMAEGGCSGSEIMSWSQDRKRLFVKGEMTCGANVQRRVSGIMALTSATQWLSVEAVTAGAHTATRTQRYTLADENAVLAYASELSANRLARATARLAAVVLLDLDDVTEAVAAVDTDVVVGWLAAVNQEFDITGRKLLALADAGVPPEVIDLLVAVSNPQHFALESAANTRERDRDDDWRDSDARVPRGIASCWDPLYSPMLGPVHASYYGYNRCYYYRPYAYNFYSPYGWNPGYVGRTPVIIVRGESNPGARVTRNGYSSGRKDNQGTVRSSGTSGSSTSTPKPSTSSGGSSSSGSSDSGSSGGGRTAKPRDQ